MPVQQIVVGCVVAFIAVLSGVYVSFTARRKGPILSNTYLFLSKEARKRADKKSEYKLVTVVFSFISAIFAFLALRIFTSWAWLYLPIGALVVCLLVYVIAEAIKTDRYKRRAVQGSGLRGEPGRAKNSECRGSQHERKTEL